MLTLENRVYIKYTDCACIAIITILKLFARGMNNRKEDPLPEVFNSVNSRYLISKPDKYEWQQN